MAAFASVEEDHHPNFHKCIIQLPMDNENYCWLQSMVCLQIANVIPDDGDSDERGQEMWIINSVEQS